VRTKLLLLTLLLFSFGCATYQSNSRTARSDFYGGKFAEAAKALEAKANEDSKDQLLYLFDRGMALQLAGDYKDSEKDWLAADKMSEVKDYVSISTEVATLVTNDNIKQYKGEDFEKVIINAFLAIDYTLQGNFEDALVECRRVNQKLYKYKFEAKRDYEQNPFARYLSALIWLASGHPDDAYIDFKETYKIIGASFPYLKYDLVKWAKRLGRFEDLKEWQQEFGDVKVPSPKEDSQTGEVILIYQQGRSAEKRPNPASHRFPKFYHRFSTTTEAVMEVPDENISEHTHEIYSISKVAIKTLDDAFAGLVAKRVAGVVVKGVIADQIAQHNQLLGMMAWAGLNAMDQADLRFWETLPDTLQIAKLRVSPGEHEIKVVGLSGPTQPSGEQTSFKVNVEAGKTLFLNWRSLR
jgi:uncharacterized protein